MEATATSLPEKQELLYEGKAKRIYRTSDPELIWVEFKDDLTAFDGKKHATLEGKGAFNNQISAVLMGMLNEQGVRTHFVRLISEREQLVRHLKMIPLEVVVRNVVAGSLSRRTGIAEGTELREPVVEFYYKSDELGDPLLCHEHITKVLGLASSEEIAELAQAGLAINRVLTGFFDQRGVTLVDFKLEFGRDSQGNLVLGDEITPDTCRLWDKETGTKMDKDRFRRDLGNVAEAYAEVLKRVGG